MISMLAGVISDAFKSWFNKIVEFILGFFAVIPQFMYFLYASCASFLDFLQYLIRKLAGLDVYYVNGQPVEGDIVVSFIRGILGIDSSPAYSAISTAFWSLVIFGVMLLVLTTIFSIIKAHYNYDSKKSHPLTIIGQSLKSLALMAIVPVVAIFGLYLSEIILKTLDTITSQQDAGQTAFIIEVEEVDGEGNPVLDENGNPKKKKVSNLSEGFVYNEAAKSYASYDFFGSVAFTSTSTFSGALFKTAAYNCNRLREGRYSVPTSKDFNKWSNFGVFYATDSGDNGREVVASQIDYAFSNCLTLQEDYRANAVIAEDSWILVSSYMYGYGAITAIGLNDVKNFSKFNIGLVYYYYNLWGFNFLIAFAGVIAFLVILGNTVFGLITRLIQLLALFLVFPPLIGIAPLDDGKAFGAWRKQFVSDVLMAYGAVIGMNLFFLILPFLNSITFFNVMILDRIMDILIMLAGLTMISKLISMLSGFIGGSDANKTGEDTRKSVGELGGKALNTTLKAANLGMKVGKGAGKFYSGAGRMIANSKAGKAIGKGISSVGGKIASSKAASWATFNLTKDGRAYLREMKDREFILQNAHLKKSTKDYIDEARAANPTKSEREIIDIANKQMDADTGSKRFSRRTARQRGFAKFADMGLRMFGGEGNINANGKIDLGGSLKAFGAAKIDLAGTAIKLTGGDILKFSGVQKKAKEMGVTDSFKNLVKDSLGPKLSGGKLGKGLKTSDDEKDEQKAREKAQEQSIKDTAQNTEDSKKALQDIVRLLGSGGGGTP